MVDLSRGPYLFLSIQSTRAWCHRDRPWQTALHSLAAMLASCTSRSTQDGVSHGNHIGLNAQAHCPCWHRAELRAALPVAISPLSAGRVAHWLPSTAAVHMQYRTSEATPAMRADTIKRSAQGLSVYTVCAMHVHALSSLHVHT